MATYIFGGLTAAALALSIWMGVKNNAEFEKQIELHAKAERRLKASQADLAGVTAKRDETVAEKEDYIQREKTEQDNLAQVTTAIEKLEAKIADTESVVAANDEKIAENDDLLKELPDPEVLIAQIDSTKEKIAQLKAEVASEKENLKEENLKEEGLKSIVVSKRILIENQSTGKSLSTLSTSVKSVYRNWGFVTLNGGNAQGVVPGSILDVLRGGEVVAKLKVTTVEQNRSAADILLDALPVVVSLRSGDRVVAEKLASE